MLQIWNRILYICQHNIIGWIYSLTLNLHVIFEKFWLLSRSISCFIASPHPLGFLDSFPTFTIFVSCFSLDRRQEAVNVAAIIAGSNLIENVIYALCRCRAAMPRISTNLTQNWGIVCYAIDMVFFWLSEWSTFTCNPTRIRYLNNRKIKWIRIFLPTEKNIIIHSWVMWVHAVGTSKRSLSNLMVNKFWYIIVNLPYRQLNKEFGIKLLGCILIRKVSWRIVFGKIFRRNIRHLVQKQNRD